MPKTVAFLSMLDILGRPRSNSFLTKNKSPRITDTYVKDHNIVKLWRAGSTKPGWDSQQLQLTVDQEAQDSFS